MPFCPQCGIDNPASARFCDQCGAMLIPVANSPATAAATSPGVSPGPSSSAPTIPGTPLVAGARVMAEVTGHPSTKYVIQHFRRRKNYRRLKGHRQPYVEVRIKHILRPGDAAPAA